MDESLTLNDRLSLQDLSESPLFQNARRTLLAVRELGVVKATATGSFNRKFTSQMFEEFMIAPPDREMTLRYNKVLNQTDAPFLLLLRHLLPAAGLLSYRKGEFQLTKRASTLLVDSHAGALNALLFRKFFLRINLAGFDRLPDAPQIQNTVGYAFYQISRWTDSWFDLADIAPGLFLPAVLDSLPAFSWS